MFEVGQKVWDVVRGEGVVVSVYSNQDYPVIVDLYSGSSESYTAGGLYQENHENPSLYPYPVEVTKKVTKPSINWEHVRDDYNYLSQDANGNAWLYWEKPELSEDHWIATKGECAEANSHVSYIPGTCDWKDSLVARPEGV